MAHSLFLDSDGVVWAAGINGDGECGLGDVPVDGKNEIDISDTDRD